MPESDPDQTRTTNEPTQAALKLALQWLGRKELLETEIAAKLAAKGFDGNTREAVLAWLRNKRLVNDTRTLVNAIERRTAGKRALGRQRIQADLEARGAAREQIEDALAGSDAESELAKMAFLLAEKRPADRAKAGRMLFGKGFEEELIETALERHFGS